MREALSGEGRLFRVGLAIRREPAHVQRDLKYTVEHGHGNNRARTVSFWPPTGTNRRRTLVSPRCRRQRRGFRR